MDSLFHYIIVLLIIYIIPTSIFFLRIFISLVFEKLSNKTSCRRHYKVKYADFFCENGGFDNILAEIKKQLSSSIENLDDVHEIENAINHFKKPPLKMRFLQSRRKTELELVENNLSVVSDVLNKLLLYKAKESKEQKDTFTRLLEEKEKELDALRISSENELNTLKATAEKELCEVQRSYITMKSSIQKEYDDIAQKPSERMKYIASLMADYLTLKIKASEDFLGQSKKYHERQRAYKISEIRAETNKLLSMYKEAQYQLDYLINMYPELSDVIEYDSDTRLSFEDMEANKDAFDYDPVSRYVSRDEWDRLSTTERNQLALDRYLKRQKNNWEIGRDYELYIAYLYELNGYDVDTFGSYMKINDLGRDLIVKKGGKTKVVQCKYWSAKKEIHENHLCQLYGTTICYCLENKLSYNDVEPVFITSTVLSDVAVKFAKMLHITVIQNEPLKDFPRIKCNVGRDELGFATKIYHLPIDPLYDKTKITKSNECYCFTVAEAESKGFRRAYRWHGN